MTNASKPATLEPSTVKIGDLVVLYRLGGGPRVIEHQARVRKLRDGSRADLECMKQLVENVPMFVERIEESIGGDGPRTPLVVRKPLYEYDDLPCFARIPDSV